MKIFPVLTFFVAVIISNINAASLNVKNVHTYEFPEQERDLLDRFWRFLYFDANFGYTLIGSKPVSLQSWNKDLLNFSPDPFAFLFDGRAKVSWEKFENSHRSQYFSLIFREFVVKDEKFNEIILINKIKLFEVYENYKGIFTKYGHVIDEKPETFVLKVLDSGNHELIGIILGFGADNSKYFQREYDLEAYFQNSSYFPYKIDFVYNDLLFCENKYINKISLPPIEVYNEKQERDHSQFEFLDAYVEQNPLSLICLPCFRALRNHPETHQLLNIYQDDQRKVAKFGLSKPFLDAILNVYSTGKIYE